MKRVILLVSLAGLLVACSQAPEAPKVSPEETYAAGLKVYTANCASCHQVDGWGVSHMQPPLVDDPVVAGDPEMLVKVVLKSPAAVLPPDRPHYGNTMPNFAHLTDQEISDLLTYLRHKYGHDASPIDLDKVHTIRVQVGA